MSGQLHASAALPLW